MYRGLGRFFTVYLWHFCLGIECACIDYVFLCTAPWRYPSRQIFLCTIFMMAMMMMMTTTTSTAAAAASATTTVLLLRRRLLLLLRHLLICNNITQSNVCSCSSSSGSHHHHHRHHEYCTEKNLTRGVSSRRCTQKDIIYTSAFYTETEMSQIYCKEPAQTPVHRFYPIVAKGQSLGIFALCRSPFPFRTISP